MTTSRERCAVCDFPLATDADDAVLDKAVSAGVPLDDATLFSDVLCWSRYAGEHREGGELANGLRHWRARALEASNAMDALEDKYAALRHSNDAAEARVEALEGALRRLMCMDGHDMTYCIHEDCGTCDECAARALLSATPPKPAPRPDATEALRVAMEALEGLLRTGEGFMEAVRDHTQTAYPWAPWDYESERARAALDLLRAHVEPTPLETAVQTHTEKETP